MPIKIIHICEDEKFINSAIQQFESCFPNSNTFHVLQSNAELEYTHIRPHECVKKCSKEELLNIANNIENSVVVILHSLSVVFYDFVLQLPKENQVVWLCFGFEVYNDVNYFKPDNLFDTITRNRFPRIKISKKNKIKEFIRPYYRVINKNLPLSSAEYKKEVIKRIDFLGSSFREEFKLICKLIKQKKIFFDFWYYPLEQILDISASVNLNKKIVLIGNSASISGNHLDVFAKIKSYNLRSEKIVVPLNYGEARYITSIVDQGYNDFGDKFQPLLQFMPLEEYNTILEDVGVAIFNNRRQQAIGNIIALLWMGAKVFLSKQNPFYKFLKRTGLYIYCYETDLNEQNCNQFLSLNQIEHNRAILFNLLNHNTLAVKLKEQIFKIDAK
jgi:dTDP-N-acetylfucosamine:lipid II N-acetylfucosaminyltransferase